MRFNIKKISSVLASAALIGSTAAMAMAATYPAPFVDGGASDVGIVVGSAADNADYTAATKIGSDLSTALAGQIGGGSTVTGEGDKIKIEKSSNKLNMNDTLNSVKSTKITDTDMPTLLADGTYESADSKTYDYEQYIEISAYKDVRYTHFKDNDYNSDKASLGIHLASDKALLNYTLDFTETALSDPDGEKLTDFVDTEITILGTTYTIINPKNKSSGVEMDLMGGAVVDTIKEGESKSYTTGGKTYSVTASIFSDTEARLTVNDETLTTVDNEGDTGTLADGTQIGVIKISYSGKTGVTSDVKFALGATKIFLQSGQNPEINSEANNDLIAYFENSNSSGDYGITKMKINWAPDDETFITNTQSATMPAFGGIKVIVGEFTTEDEEVIKIKGSGNKIEIVDFPFKDGSKTIGILYGNDTGYRWIGEDDDDNGLVTDGCNDTNIGQTGVSCVAAEARDGLIHFNETRDDQYFVATYNTSTEAESYLLSAKISQDSNDINYTTIKNEITGDTYKLKPNEIATIGDVEIYCKNVLYDNKISALNFTTCAGNCNFENIYSAGGLRIDLPLYNISGHSGGTTWGYLGYNDTKDNVHRRKFPLVLWEEDKDGNLGKGKKIHLNLTWSSNDAEVGAMHVGYFAAGATTANKETEDDSDTYEGYCRSDLATRVLWYKPTDGQKWIELTYYGEEAYGNVWIASADISLDSEATNILPVYDSEVSGVQSKNLIVVGGSCVNTVAASLVGGSYCEEEWTSATGVGEGQYLIEVFESPYSSSKVAMLVAGYEKADTTRAADYLIATDVTTTVGTSMKKSTATDADIA